MHVGATLHKSFDELREMGVEEIAWWMAYLKYVEELQESRRAKNKPKAGRARRAKR